MTNLVFEMRQTGLVFSSDLIIYFRIINGWALVACAFNRRVWEAEAGRSLRVQGEPLLQELVPRQAPKL